MRRHEDAAAAEGPAFSAPASMTSTASAGGAGHHHHPMATAAHGATQQGGMTCVSLWGLPDTGASRGIPPEVPGDVMARLSLGWCRYPPTLLTAGAPRLLHLAPCRCSSARHHDDAGSAAVRRHDRGQGHLHRLRSGERGKGAAPPGGGSIQARGQGAGSADCSTWTRFAGACANAGLLLVTPPCVGCSLLLLLLCVQVVVIRAVAPAGAAQGQAGQQQGAVRMVAEELLRPQAVRPVTKGGSGGRDVPRWASRIEAPGAGEAGAQQHGGGSGPAAADGDAAGMDLGAAGAAAAVAPAGRDAADVRAGAPALEPWGVRDRPYVIAHRGNSGQHPEHTVEAYRSAIEQGVLRSPPAVGMPSYLRACVVYLYGESVATSCAQPAL